MLSSMLTRLLAVTFLVALAVPAFGSDGVREINQACAESTGCVAGDTPGLPVTISQRGSYRLTGDLTTGDQDARAIEVLADDVTIDLGGFSIVGPVTCTGAGASLSCSAAGGGDGIYAGASSHTTVLNGTIRGAGRDGLLLGDNCRVDGVTTQNNGRSGIAGGDFCIVRNSSARGNPQDGIVFGDSTAVENSVSAENTDNGVELGASSTALGVRASGNDVGIRIGGASLAKNCVAEGNVNHGVSVNGPGSRVESCVTTDNNIGIKIDADGCTVVNNTSTDNTSEGIGLGTLATSFYSHCVIDGNHVARNTARGLAVNGTDNLIVRNVSYGNGTAYFVGPNNQVGTIVSAIDAAGVVGTSGGNLGTTIGPWANFAR